MRGLPVSVLVTAVGSGLVAGVFFGFSSFVMRALGRLPVPQGIAAMQSINGTAVGPAFMVVFMGTALASLALSIVAGTRLGQPGMPLLLAGSLLYVVGCFGVTVVGNVPLNDALATAKPESPEGAALWTRYLGAWTMWNYIRTVASTGAVVLMVLGLRALSVEH